MPGDAVLRVVGCLGVGALKPSLNVQAALLRWLVMVYHVVEGRGVLARAYPVLFNLLDVAAIRWVSLLTLRTLGLMFAGRSCVMSSP